MLAPDWNLDFWIINHFKCTCWLIVKKRFCSNTLPNKLLSYMGKIIDF